MARTLISDDDLAEVEAEIRLLQSRLPHPRNTYPSKKTEPPAIFIGNRPGSTKGRVIPELSQESEPPIPSFLLRKADTSISDADTMTLPGWRPERHLGIIVLLTALFLQTIIGWNETWIGVVAAPAAVWFGLLPLSYRDADYVGWSLVLKVLSWPQIIALVFYGLWTLVPDAQNPLLGPCGFFLLGATFVMTATRVLSD